MLIRSLTGAFITFVVYLTLFFSYIPAVLHCGTALLAVCAVYEIYRASGAVKNEPLLYLSLPLSAAFITVPLPHAAALLSVLFVLSIPLFAYLMTKKAQDSTISTCHGILIALLVVMLFKSFPVLRTQENGLYYLTNAVTLCFVTDCAAYLIGKPFGKHKLIPRISPNKTIEGTMAGILCAIAAAILVGALLTSATNVAVSYAALILYALCASLIAQFGDLSMSAVKRICGIKDFGRVLPGHGGVLDRFDSHLFTIPFTLLYVTLTGGWIT